MKKRQIILLAFIIIMTSCLPAFGIDTLIPIITDPIIVEPVITPIIVTPLIPTLFYTRAVYTTPLYRLYNSSAEKHSYTSSTSEKNDLISAGWTDDGIVAYVSPVSLPGYVPVNRYELLGQFEILTTSTYSESWWDHTGTLGYISSSSFMGSTTVHESVKALEEGENYFDTDYYYSDKYKTVGPFTFAYPPVGYNLTDKRFNMWDESTKVQEVILTDISSSVTGGKSYTLNWTTLVAGGYVDLHYSTDNGSSWTTIVENRSNSSTSGSYQWTLPNITSEQMKVKIYWKSTSGGSSSSWDTSNTFSVTKDYGKIESIIDPGIVFTKLAPASPTSLTAKASIISPQITLYWTDNSTIETGFTIQRKTPMSIYVDIGTAAENATSYKDSSISSGVKYTYRIKANGSILDSGYTNEATGSYTGLLVEPTWPEDLTPLDTPDPPSDIEAEFTDGSMTEVLISWNPPSGDYTGFNIERKTGSTWNALGSTTEDDYNFVDVDLAGLSGEIFYRVKSYNIAMTSSPSDEVSVNTEGEEIEEHNIFDDTQSAWAESELIDAFENGLTYPGVMYDYDRAITREEFCVLAVKLYEKLTGLNTSHDEDPFDDTDNPDILIAYKLGIVKGISETEFAPSNNITRQEMCVMLYRALAAANYETSIEDTATFPFDDVGSIASWAINEVKFCHQNGIMNGTSPSTIDPLLNTPREQAIILVNRTYNSFSSH